MDAELIGAEVKVKGVCMCLEEALFLMKKGGLRIKGDEGELGIEEFIRKALKISPKFHSRYATYEDLRSRGYFLRDGGIDFMLYPRGRKPGEGASSSFVWVVSERDVLSMGVLLSNLQSAENVGKRLLMAMVDEESGVTYYSVRTKQVNPVDGEPKLKCKGSFVGESVLIHNGMEELRRNFFGRRGSNHISLLEGAYLAERGMLELDMDPHAFIERCKSLIPGFGSKLAVYSDLRSKGYVVKTGFKFGADFRVYDDPSTHSKYLVLVVDESKKFLLSELSRCVRLARSVRKKMLFALPGPRYVCIEREKL